MEMTKIIFYFPYHEECGVPVLFLRMSKWLAKNHGDEFDVYVGDYVDGAMARNLTVDDHVKICASGTPEGITVSDGDILVMQTLNPYYFPKELHLSPKAKLFYWTLHFQNLIPSLLPIPGLRELPFRYLWVFKLCSIFYQGLLGRMRKLADDMMAHEALYFMDVSTLKQTILHLPIHVPSHLDYLPVPASDYNGPLKQHNNDFSCIEACWIGRISYEKTPILVHTLIRCSRFALENKQKIHFHVVGSGEFENWVNNLDIENEYFSKTKCVPIKFSEIDEFLLKNIDIMFAMGTSALEAAKLGVPTVLVDCTPTKEPIKGDYVFKYIHERVGFDLGHTIGEEDLEDNNESLAEIFRLLKESYGNLSEKSRSHFVNKHSLSSVGDKFYDIMKKMSFTFDMIDPKVIERPFLLKVYNKLRGFNKFE